MTAPTLTLTPNDLSGTYTIDAAHSRVGFVARHAMVTKVRGTFNDFSGSLTLDFGDLDRSSAEVTIDVASIDTRQEQRDAHLRSPDFFDVEKFPSITFQSTRIEVLGGGRYNVYGDLTIRDVTREVVLETTDEGRGGDPWGGERAGFSATTRIDRRDFGLTWNQALETGGVMVGDEVKLQLEVEAVKA